MNTVSTSDLSRVTTIGTKGQVVIPSEIRAALELEAGDEVIVRLEGSSVRIITRKTLVNELFGVYAQNDGRDLTNELLEERRIEASKKWL